MAPEEARVLEMLFEDGPAILINPAKGEEWNKYLLAIDGHLRKLNGVYFTRNARYIVLGILASLATAMGMALTAQGRDTHGAVFLTWWFFFCRMGLGAIGSK